MRLNLNVKTDWKTFWLIIIIAVLIVVLVAYIVALVYDFPLLEISHYNNCSCPTAYTKIVGYTVPHGQKISTNYSCGEECKPVNREPGIMATFCPANTTHAQTICDCAKNTTTPCMVFCWECVTK